MNCDPIARAYRWLEYGAFGRALERRRFRFLDDVRNAKSALLLGDGDGRFLQALLRSSPAVQVEVIEASTRMLALAKARAGSGRVVFRQGDARDAPLGEYDLVATHFFLDCFDRQELEPLIRRITAAAQRDWIISDFRPLKSAWARAWVWFLYRFFRITTGLKNQSLVDHRPLLEANGFALQKVETEWLGLLASELWRKR